MEYKILDNGGVILTRQPETITDNLNITFTSAPDNATAIFDTGTDTIYRKLVNNSCAIPKRLLTGEIKVTLTVLDGKAKAPVYPCEGLKAQALASGEILISPDDMDLPAKVAGIQVDIQNVKDSIQVLADKYTALEDKLESLIEGYDVT